eukprot:GFUD01089928.1.p1 GENE.GFUD01089928.1~~GFUD01089928.1.p1  ORF type:complete len:970 (+),score=206.26 GFUD01089928.1:1-2910(+)
MIAKANQKVNKDFKNMVIDDYKFKNFLRTLGIKESLNSRDVLQYIDENFVNNDMVDFHDRITTFMESLVKDKVFENEEFLRELATRKFLPRGYPKWAAQIVSFDIRSPISIRGSIDSSGIKYAWNVTPCLERNYFGYLKKDHEKLLGIWSKDKIKGNILVKNFKNICIALKENKVLASNWSYNYTEIVMKLGTLDADLLENELYSIPCILQKDWTLSSPKMTCLDLTEDFHPYLVRFPVERGNILNVFEKCGLSRSPKPLHFLTVLETIASNLDGNAIENPNVANIVKLSFDMFLERLSKDCDLVKESGVMFFPTNAEKPKLVESEKLVFDDWPELTLVLHDQNYEYVQRNDKFKQKYSLIPNKWKPRRLSEMFKMEVSLEKSVECCDPACTKFTDLRKCVSSQHFSEALIRLIKHYQERFNLPEVSNQNFTDFHQYFKHLTIQCYSCITTEVVDKDSGHSLDSKLETRKSVLKSRSPLIMGLEHGMLSPELEDSRTPEEHICTVIVEMLSNKYQEMDYQWEILEKCISKLLKSTPNKMKEVLDRENIESMEKLAEDKYFRIGEIIPEDVVSTLVHDPFLSIRNKSIVAYHMDDDIFMYAQIEDCSGDEKPSSFITIDIGEGELKSVQLLDILFFPLFSSKCSDVSSTVAIFDGLVDSDTHGHSGDDGGDEPFVDKNKKFDRDLKDIFDVVSKQLEENYNQFKNDEKAWLKFVKRMLFTWHPDKNPGYEEQATEVVKFIQNEVERIEKGLPRGQENRSNNNSNSDFGNFRGDFWRDFFRNCDDTARDQRYQYQNYHQNFQRQRTRENPNYQNDFRWNVPPSFKTNNLGAARMWLEVAKTDLKAAEENLAAENYRVAAYMCRLVIEMCVKSVELTCTRTFTKTHDIRSIIGSLPAMDIKEDLIVAWRENVPDILKNYSDIFYKGLNRYTGEDPREFFKQHRNIIKEAINNAQRDFINICEHHLLKFENNC